MRPGFGPIPKGPKSICRFDEAHALRRKRRDKSAFNHTPKHLQIPLAGQTHLNCRNLLKTNERIGDGLVGTAQPAKRAVLMLFWLRAVRGRRGAASLPRNLDASALASVLRKNACDLFRKTLK